MTTPQWRCPQCGAGPTDGCWDLEAEGSCPAMEPVGEDLADIPPASDPPEPADSAPPATTAPMVTASAETIAAMVREYFALEKWVQATDTSNRERHRRRTRLGEVRQALVRAVDFDESYHPHLPWVIARRKAARKAAAVAAGTPA